MRRIAIFITLCCFSLLVAAQNTVKHEVLSGQTLYSIARSYGVDVKELLRLNPGLEADHVRAGQKINVPNTNGNKSGYTINLPQNQQQGKYKTQHKVQKKETIYSISNMYGITQDQLIAANPELKKGKLKKGAIINIPYSEKEVKHREDSIKEAQKKADDLRRKEEERSQQFHAAVIMPFGLNNENMTNDAQKVANLYQGFLLAVDTLKHQGYNVNVYAYDETLHDIYTILSKPMMKNMNVIIGPIQQGNVVAVADFAKNNNIIHVVTQTQSTTLLNEHPTTFQVNTPNTVQYSMAAQRFLSMHRSDNVIFLAMNDKSDNPAAVSEMKRAFDNANEMYHSTDLGDINKLKDMLKTDKLNVIVPSASSAAAFNTLCNKLNTLNLDSSTRIQLFGYPDWQTLPSKHYENMRKYNCQFFTSFYHNGTSQSTRTFESNFSRWFHQPQYNALPRYGELGYDIGMFFLRGLKQYGKDFQKNVATFSTRTLEFPMHFERKSEWSGWQNKSVLIVTYNRDGGVSVK